MALTFDTLAALYDHGFDDVIDVRSPAEFAEDHLPGAINLPVLDNDERARVGTMYTQDSRFRARKVGAALVVRNVAQHLDTVLADRPRDWRPLVYCWRGGQRSGTFTWLMREIGWRAEAIDGGYRTYRRMVATMLHDQPLKWRFVLLSGMTCTAKTVLLDELDRLGTQVLDLEGAAHHRGSVFGGHASPQPAQKMLETRLAAALSRLDPSRPVVVEAESSKIGKLLVPPQIWAAMCAAPRIEVSADLSQRAAFFMTAYADLVAAPDTFCQTLEALVPFQGRAKVEAWQDMVRAGDVQAVAAGLMGDHYDPGYTRSLARQGAQRWIGCTCRRSRPRRCAWPPGLGGSDRPRRWPVHGRRVQCHRVRLNLSGRCQWSGDSSANLGWDRVNALRITVGRWSGAKVSGS